MVFNIVEYKIIHRYWNEYLQCKDAHLLSKFTYIALTWNRFHEKLKRAASLQPLLYLAPRPGLEPGTCGLTVRRSTNWAIREWKPAILLAASHSVNSKREIGALNSGSSWCQKLAAAHTHTLRRHANSATLFFINSILVITRGGYCNIINRSAGWVKCMPYFGYGWEKHPTHPFNSYFA